MGFQALIVRGCITDHGGIIQEADSSFIIDGIPVHLEGMSHWCPKCKCMSRSISNHDGFMPINGRNAIVGGDKATCGATYISNQNLVVREQGNIKTQLASLNDILNKNIYDEQVLTEFEFSEGMPYFIETDDGKTYKGTIGSNGKLPRIKTEKEGTYQIFLGEVALEKGDMNGG